MDEVDEQWLGESAKHLVDLEVGEERGKVLGKSCFLKDSDLFINACIYLLK